jgi:hypothetical protein
MWIRPGFWPKSFIFGTISFKEEPIPKKISCCSVCRPAGVQLT